MITYAFIAGAAAATAMARFYTKEQKHRQRLADLEVNIHVNGIRGKSTVTRMLGGMLRECDYNTITKTTGTYACVISEDASEHPIKRVGPANINEQYRVVSNNVTDDTEAVVFECMAVKPKYQKICQDDILRSPLSIITNVRLDHQEDMGDTLEEIAISLSSTIPFGGTCITGERDPKILKVLREQAEKRQAQLIVAERTDESELLVGRFDYLQFEENVAVALAVADFLGLDRTTAIHGMVTAVPDPGTTTVTEIHPTGHEAGLWWAPMFAVNDWESTLTVFNSVMSKVPDNARVAIAMNNRADRTDRAEMFVDLIATELHDASDHIILYGEIQEAVARSLNRASVPDEKVTLTSDIEQTDGAALLSCARKAAVAEDRPLVVIGLANIHTDAAGAMQKFVDDNRLKLVPSAFAETMQEPALSSSGASI